MIFKHITLIILIKFELSDKLIQNPNLKLNKSHIFNYTSPKLD